MSHPGCVLCLKVGEFVESPGKRFAIDLRTKVEEVDSCPSMRFVGGISLRGDGFAQMGTLYVSSEVRASVERPCSRCLAPIRVDVERREDFEAAIPSDAEEIDLLPQALAAVLSGLVSHPLCRRTCRGLCPACGADLNLEGEHHCRKAGGEGRRLGDFLT